MMPSKFKVLLEALSKNTVFIEYLEHLEDTYSDMRTLESFSEEGMKIRMEALKLLRDNLLGKLLILSGKEEQPDNDEYN